MNKTELTVEKDGFYGIYYPNPQESSAAMIAMAGDACDDYMAKKCVKWLHGLGLNVLAMSPGPRDYSCHNYPIERFGRAIAYLKQKKNTKFGFFGASTTGMLALLAASFYPEITMTVAISPSDFVMEGYYQEKGVERPGDGESTVSVGGVPLPYLPFAYRHPEYWQKIQEEAKRGKNMIASREMFDRSEQLHPVTEAERIKVEKIQGRMVLLGAEDDCLWDTCKYIRRIEERLREKNSPCQVQALLYEHATHFLFPQSLMKMLLPIGSGLLPKLAFQAARAYPKACKQARMDADQKVKAALSGWFA